VVQELAVELAVVSSAEVSEASSVAAESADKPEAEAAEAAKQDETAEPPKQAEAAAEMVSEEEKSAAAFLAGLYWSNPVVVLVEAFRRLCRFKPAAVVKAKRWHTLSVIVQGPKAEVFLDGAKISAALVPRGAHHDDALAGLGLGRRVVLFGGGTQAEARGGSLRLVLLEDAALPPVEVARLHRTEVPSRNPLFKGAAVRIQTVARKVAAKAKATALRKELGVPEPGAKEPEDGDGENSDESDDSNL
jgi:hypothetical protein